MPLPQTEHLHPKAIGLDARSDAEILDILRLGQVRALDALAPAMPAMAKAAGLMATSLQGGGRLIYAAAGSSALMALADGAELGGTFGIAPDRIVILMAGGLPLDARMPGATEDDVTTATQAAAGITPCDVVIAISASGATPYAATIQRIAQAVGARTICIANTPKAAMFAHADVAICLPTPPEVISGSTRMGAATAQKAVLNMMSTLMGIRLGHVHDGMMVNLLADNAKLRDRAVRVVTRIAGVSDARARDCLDAAQGAVKPAVLIALGVADADAAAQLLDQTKGQLRAAMALI